MNRELGFPSGVKYLSYSFGAGTGPTWMDRVNCDGDEDTLLNCSFPGWEIKDCSKTDIAGVKCGLSKYYRGMIPPFEMEQLYSF